jgi:hypothetical protein
MHRLEGEPNTMMDGLQFTQDAFSFKKRSFYEHEARAALKSAFKSILC